MVYPLPHFGEPTAENITRALHYLAVGDSAGAETSANVAQTLAAHGITGLPMASNQCPLARFLRLGFPNISWVTVGFSIAHVDEHSIALPDAVRNFRRDFDHYRYPSLISA